MKRSKHVILAMCVLAASWLLPGPAALAQKGKVLRPGKLQVVGRYPKKKMKEGKKPYRYSRVEAGEKFRLRVGGPTAVMMITRAAGKKRVTFNLDMDGKKTGEVQIEVLKVTRSFAFRVPEGTHQIEVVPSSAVLFRPMAIKKPRKGVPVVAWKDAPADDIGVVAIAPTVDEKPEPPPAPPEEKPAPADEKPEPPPGKEPAAGGTVEVEVLKIVTVPEKEPEPPVVEERPAPPPEPPEEKPAVAAGTEQPAGDWSILVGLKLGGVVPRTELDFNAGYALSVEGGLDPLLTGLHPMLSGFAAYFEIGYALLKHQGDEIIPGRGRTGLIQNTHTVPMELGVRYRYADDDWPVWPYGRVGLALDVSRTTFEAFSTGPVQENDLSPGFGLTAGALVPLWQGGILVELRYREVWAQMHEMGDLGEDMLSAFSFWAGYQLDFAL